MPPKVSVIIPVYNTAPYLRRCLDSVTGQTLRDIEIICVNDGSTDESPEILREYAEKDSRIRLIDFQTNKGAAAARNGGLNEAKGDFLSFIDSDDYIERDFLELLAGKANDDTDIVKGNIRVFNIDGTQFSTSNEAIKRNKYNFTIHYTTAIYRRNLIIRNNVKFPENLSNGEDIVFLIQAVHHAKGVDTVEDAFYNYAKSADSLDSRYYDIDKINSVISAREIIIDHINRYNIDAPGYIYTFIEQMKGLVFLILCSTEPDKKFVTTIIENKLKIFHSKCKYLNELYDNEPIYYDKYVISCKPKNSEPNQIKEMQGEIFLKLRKKFSIITVCLNAPNLERTCESIVNQTFQDFEWIVIDGGSNVETLAILEKYKSRMDYFLSEPDGGVYFGMNKGIKQATGERLHFLNAGDCYADWNVLSTVNSFAELLPDVLVLHGKMRMHNGDLIFTTDEMLVKTAWVVGCSIQQSTAFHKLEVFKQFGNFRTDYKIVSDYAFYMKLFFNGCTFGHIDCIVTNFDEPGLSSFANPLHLAERQKVIEEFFTKEEILARELEEKAKKLLSNTVIITQLRDKVRKLF